MTSQGINSDQIAHPRLTLTEPARRELKLILENDFTLKGQVLRIQISGKECHGFTYSCGFTQQEPEDFILEQLLDGPLLKIALDPFTAFYLKAGQVDFVMEPEKNREGLVVTNFHQEEYTGKFWQRDKNKIPPTAY